MMNRRRFLRSTGIAGLGIALPLLDVMRDGHGLVHAGGGATRRLILFHWPQGLPVGWGAADGGWWYPSTFGPEWTPTAGLQPLVDANVIDDVNVLSGLTYRQIHASVGAHGHAAAYMTGYTALPESAGSSEPTTQGPSVDQVAGQRIGKATKFASVSTGLYDQGEGWWSWSAAGVRAPLEVSPRQLWNRLFSDLDLDPAAADKAAARTKSVLDFVEEDIASLQGELGASDRQRLDEHLTTIRELERQVEAGGVSAECSQPAEPQDVAYGDADCDAYAKLMIDLVAMALRCDLTRVAMVSLGPSQNYRTFPHVDVPYTYHNVAHSGGAMGGPDIDQTGEDRDAIYRRIALWHMEMLAYFVQALKGSDGAENLLADSAFIASSEFSSGNMHLHEFLPVVVAGGLGGMATGQSIALPCTFDEDWQTPAWCDVAGKPDRCINDLWTTALRAVGALAETEVFGDPSLDTEPLEGLWS
jgi:hypothetical protein